ncbi:hypothetical protein DMB66_55035 [Actinoplanes sp. ATCC 53533]|uniref:coiled-coil domain-containing protein n=1 Tax=Actinoplanes sp. ATCC 53533 TaxID=1288362 RepID=UPI000F77E411|nr:hypothetical protein [Actinoplanes sp. ATCC 53533]RSM42181.1 hypothetical protein DMB66_55035 [Actinoplanes sp. ATCC 53533]
MTANPRRWLVLALAPLVAASLVMAAGSAASAEPDGSTATPKEADDSPMLVDVLTTTGRRFVAAKAAVGKSAKTQLRLALDVKAAEARRDSLIPQVQAVAGQQYRTGSISAMSFLLKSETPGGFVQKAISLAEINRVNDGKLRELNAAIADVAAAKDRLDREVKAQRQSLAVMSKQKEAAEKALAVVGGKSLTGGYVSAKSPVAAAAPRNSDGGFTPESCTVDDPTTGGCITARTANMLKQAKKADFNRFVGCYRPGGPFEHPKGRACDWSLQEKGFSNARNADMKNYGNDLMAFLVRNADRLGILYVIWYRQVWFPASGWSPYTGPLDHYDHVHVSML